MLSISIKKSKANKFEEFSAFVSFKYNERLVNLMRTIPVRYYDKVTKEWEIPTDKIEYVRQNAGSEVKITGMYKLDTVDSNCMPNEFSFITKPFMHQIQGVNYGLTHTHWILGDEMGLGKTKQIIDLAVCNKLKHGYKHCLIVCGVNGLKWNWYYEVLKHSNETAWILGQRKKNNKITVKSNKEKLEDIKNIDNINSYFIITNVETLRSDEITKELKKLCKDKIINMIAVDECHKCANPTSQQSRGLLELKAENQIALSGTPLMNKPTDLYTPLKWLGYENHTFYQFQRHYCVYGGFGGYQIVGYKNLDELQEKISKIMLRRLKQDVLDLPEKVYINEYVELTKNQQKIYNEVHEELKENIDKITIAPNPLAQLTRLRQATGYTGILSSTIKESAKLDRLKELVQEHTENGQKVVIFSNWTQMTDVLYQQLNAYNPALITGEINTDKRKEQEDKFQTNDLCKVIIGTIGAMGTGLTLTAGTVVIFVDQPWTRANYEQAVDRCHRIGVKNNITIYNLITKNTIDERIYEIVYKKGVLSDALIDMQITGNKLETLNYLLN